MKIRRELEGLAVKWLSGGGPQRPATTHPPKECKDSTGPAFENLSPFANTGTQLHTFMIVPCLMIL